MGSTFLKIIRLQQLHQEMMGLIIMKSVFNFRQMFAVNSSRLYSSYFRRSLGVEVNDHQSQLKSADSGVGVETESWNRNKLIGRGTIRRFHALSCVQFAEQSGKNENKQPAGGGEKVLKVKLKATRLDAVLKAGLSLSRNKIEKAFYEDRVRINGERPQKKSQPVFEGDEVDIVRNYNQLNPDQFIDVSRVEVEELGEAEDDDESGDSDSDEESSKIPAVLRRSKVLTIRNYRTPWKGSSQD